MRRSSVLVVALAALLPLGGVLWWRRSDRPAGRPDRGRNRFGAGVDDHGAGHHGATGQDHADHIASDDDAIPGTPVPGDGGLVDERCVVVGHVHGRFNCRDVAWRR